LSGFDALSQVKVKEAITELEIDRVSRSRYEIYIEEMKGKQIYADHEQKIIKEPLDETGHIFYAYTENDEIMGSIRVNFARDGLLEYPEYYDFHKFGGYFSEHCSMTTKLMVKNEYRNFRISLELARAALLCGVKNNILFDFIDTNPHLIPLYHGLGYFIYKDNFEHPEYGYVTPMVFATHNIEHLKKVNFPFLDIVEKYKWEDKSVDLLKNIIYDRGNLYGKPTRDYIRRLLAQIAGIDINTFDESANLRTDLNIESIASIQILVAIETELNIVIDEVGLFDVVTVGDFVDMVIGCLPEEETYAS